MSHGKLTVAPVGLVGALEAEMRDVRDAMCSRTTRSVHGREVHVGSIADMTVLLAIGGVGKVNGATAASALAAQGAGAIVVMGVSGAITPGLVVGDVVVPTSFVQHDVDLTALGRRPGELMGEPAAWNADATLAAHLRSACRIAGVETVAGVSATGDQFVSDEAERDRISSTFGASIVDMETAAAAQVCAGWGLPMAAVRMVSDTADDDAVTDFPSLLDKAAAFLAVVAQGLADSLHERPGA